MTDFTRRAALGAALAATAFPLRAQSLEDKGYALGAQILGAEDAPLMVTEYFSLTCGHCANFHNNVLPDVKKNYIDTGKLRMVFREVYFDQYGLWAGMIARCGGEQTYFSFVETFFEQMSEWIRESDIVAALQRIGRLGGLPADRMQACLSDEDFMRRLVGDFQEHAKKDGINSTPSFVSSTGETLAGGRPYPEFAAWLDGMLEQG